MVDADARRDSVVRGHRRHRAPRGSVVRGVRGHRLAVLLSLPTLMLVVLAGVGVFGQIQLTSAADKATDDVKLVLATQDLIHSLQRERGLSSGLLSGATRYRGQVDAQRPQSDEARTALDRELAGDGSANARAVRTGLGKLANLQSIRRSVDTGSIARPALLDFYTAAISTLNSAVADPDADDRQLRRDMQALAVLGDAKEATALERGHLNGVFAAGAFTQDDYIRFTEVRATKQNALSQLSRVASARRKTGLDYALRTPQATVAATFEEQALKGAEGQQLKLSATTWWDAMTTVVDDMRGVQQGIGKDVETQAGHIKGQAIRQLGFYVGGAALTLAFGLLLWLYTFRSIMRPLQILTDEAHAAAERDLPAAVARIEAADDPDQVALDTSGSVLTKRRDEFAEVADALDHLQATAIRLAVAQAVMRRNTAESLANLGRRNQNLVRRQLGLISDLERDEADPDALANLFKLDHLATRMRRNAESLLVLVGEQSPRRWSGSVAVGDVLRAAFAEVEDYQRVVLRRVDDTRVRGSATAEISHLLAELIENALRFSPPGQDVEIQAKGTGSQYHIAIVDQGVGMAPEAMAIANARLRGEQSFLVAPTRDLGHYVVGQLAQRLGIEVWLHQSTLNGVTARVTLPAALLDTPEKPAAAAASTVRATTGRQVAGADQGPRPTAASLAVAPRSNAAAENGAANPADNGMVAPPENGVAAPAATTRNGLIKRQPRERPLRQQPERPPEPERGDTPKRAPQEVQSMLNNLMAGYHHERTVPTGRADEEATDR